MTRPLVAAALAAVTIAVGSACDFRALILDTDAIPGQRQAAATECCACLARATSPDADVMCPADGSDAGSADAGPATCLCGGIDAESCAARLSGGADIELLGACVDTGGPCAGPCEDVLAFP